MIRSVKCQAPASIANVACGFDVLGFAVEEPHDEVIVRLSDKKGVTISKISGDDGRLPTATESNTAGISIRALLESLRSDQGVDVEIIKGVPIGSGMGSSAASAVAAVVAANSLLGSPYAIKDLLPFAIEGEKASSGTVHADNVGPSLLGGFVLVRSYSPLDVVNIPTPENLICTVVHPTQEVNTRHAREMLPKSISLQDAIIQWGNIAGLIAGLTTSDFDLIRRSMQDNIVEPVRSQLMNGFMQVKNAALEAGAIGCSIAGSGPAIFAFSNNIDAAQIIGKRMQVAFKILNVTSKVFISRINPNGAVITG